VSKGNTAPTNRTEGTEMNENTMMGTLSADLTAAAIMVKQMHRQPTKDQTVRGTNEGIVAAHYNFGMLLDGMMSEGEFEEMCAHAEACTKLDNAPLNIAKRAYGHAFLDTIEGLVFDSMTK
jgi:hypothetical protein